MEFRAFYGIYLFFAKHCANIMLTGGFPKMCNNATDDCCVIQSEKE